jgi:hypothetical protein
VDLFIFFFLLPAVLGVLRLGGRTRSPSAHRRVLEVRVGMKVPISATEACLTRSSGQHNVFLIPQTDSARRLPIK